MLFLAIVGTFWLGDLKLVYKKSSLEETTVFASILYYTCIIFSLLLQVLSFDYFFIELPYYFSNGNQKFCLIIGFFGNLQ